MQHWRHTPCTRQNKLWQQLARTEKGRERGTGIQEWRDELGNADAVQLWCDAGGSVNE
jgi:hypothetical protein